jgi:hypothetical protein
MDERKATVRDLIEFLKTIPEDAEISVLSEYSENWETGTLFQKSNIKDEKNIDGVEYLPTLNTVYFGEN